MEDLKQQWTGLRDNYKRCIQKRQLKQRPGAGSSKLPVCRYFEQLQFLHNTVSNEELGGNTDIEFAKRKFGVLGSFVVFFFEKKTTLISQNKGVS